MVGSVRIAVVSYWRVLKFVEIHSFIYENDGLFIPSHNFLKRSISWLIVFQKPFESYQAMGFLDSLMIDRGSIIPFSKIFFQSFEIFYPIFIFQVFFIVIIDPCGQVIKVTAAVVIIPGGDVQLVMTNRYEMIGKLQESFILLPEEFKPLERDNISIGFTFI